MQAAKVTSSQQQEQEKAYTHIHQVSHILLTAPKPNEAEGKLITNTVSDGQTSFHTTLQVITKQGTKPIPVKVDPGADVNTIPLSHYKKNCLEKINKGRSHQEQCFTSYFTSMVITWKEAKKIYRIFHHRCSSQDPSQDHANQIQCVWRYN